MLRDSLKGGVYICDSIVLRVAHMIYNSFDSVALQIDGKYESGSLQRHSKNWYIPIRLTRSFNFSMEMDTLCFSKHFNKLKLV